jgi:hypothetical protein
MRCVFERTKDEQLFYPASEGAGRYGSEPGEPADARLGKSALGS